MVEISINPTKKQYVAWKYLLDSKTKFLLFGGGAGGGKSWNGCEWLLVMSMRYPGTKWFIGRNELKRLMMSTYITMLKVFKHHDFPRDQWKLNGQLNYIEFANGSRIDLLDVAYKPSDPLYERFGSTEYTGGWLEEVGEINFKAFDVLKSRIGRHLNKEYSLPSKLFLTCNPKKNWVYFMFYALWKKDEMPEGYVFIQSLYKDNPYTADEYGKNLSEIKDSNLRTRLMDGNWEYDDDPAKLFEYDKLIDMFNNDYVKEGTNAYITCDVARFGRDLAVVYLWRGLKLVKVYTYDKSSTKFLRLKLESLCHQHHVPRSHVAIDEDGVGGGLVDEMEGVKGFVNNSSPIIDDNKEQEQESKRYNYKNLRSQCYFELANYINKGLLSITKDVLPEYKEKIMTELEAIKRKDIDKDGPLAIISKEEIKEVLGHSPDFADALMFRMYFELSSFEFSFEFAGLTDDDEYDTDSNREKNSREEIFKNFQTMGIDINGPEEYEKDFELD